jgi:tRNA nucleotidyltransferase (CCA-adding enzyme)
MKIILTHEQADFDAVASQLGAYLLDETYIPVQPRKMNRNVRAFLTLYGVDLPHVSADELPKEPVDTVKLVDTQSMISVKGMNPATQVHVIDHHPLRDDLPADWKLTVSGTGANTTLFVETLRDRDIVLNTVQSTLLLLGIYEDTGSLTYSRTTARDLRAAGYLLDQGASLQIATDFLNHPLSKEQQDIYDQLRATAEFHNVHGHTVVIASGDARKVDEELSTIAHKLRDLLDPDALFVLVSTRGGVQLIARSNNDSIDVARISANFGGGGHERAAAAIIKDRSLDLVHQELIQLLPKQVNPAITVSQIMSRSPQTLSPITLVDEAARLMQRYGHEGYPVVKDGSVIGLLTRRAVDRALSHNLNPTVDRVMDAGEYTVSPMDSIEHLQRLMTDSGWGQIPVVQPETGQIIGIVTRTDLFKTLSPRSRVPSRLDLVEKLERALPESLVDFLKVIAQISYEQHAAVYIVGGFVRDLLLDRPSLDYDLVVEGDAEAVARGLARRYGGRVTSHTRFGTAKWIQRPTKKSNNLHRPKEDEPVIIGEGSVELPDSLDLVSARTEFYTYPTALPTVERGSIKLDLHRRDFTINTLALRLDGNHYGELHDYWGGLADLCQGLVRILHSLSFVDDPTRILRAVRFEQRFDFLIEKRTLELLREALSLLDRVSGDRIRHELNIILSESRACAILDRLAELGILSAIHQDLVWDSWLQKRFERLSAEQPDHHWSDLIDRLDQAERTMIAYIFWMLRLSPGLARNIAERLKLSAGLRRMIHSAVYLWHDLPGIINQKPSIVTSRLNDIQPLGLYAIYCATDDVAVKDVIVLYVTSWRKMAPSITGDDLKSRGIPPGPVYRKILEDLRKAWLDGEITSVEEETELIDRFITRNLGKI